MFDYPSYLEKLTAGKPVENPFLDFLGIAVEEIREGYARFSMEIRPEFLQGTAHRRGNGV